MAKGHELTGAQRIDFLFLVFFKNTAECIMVFSRAYQCQAGFFYDLKGLNPYIGKAGGSVGYCVFKRSHRQKVKCAVNVKTVDRGRCT